MSACACDGGQLRPLDEALAELLARAPRPPACESLALERALGRVLGEDLLAPMDLPHWDNSAMDGYALCSADLPRSGGSLTVGARIAAIASIDRTSRGTGGEHWLPAASWVDSAGSQEIASDIVL